MGDRDTRRNPFYLTKDADGSGAEREPDHMLILMIVSNWVFVREDAGHAVACGIKGLYLLSFQNQPLGKTSL